jgi:phytoene dehydrogenase-like protein
MYTAFADVVRENGGDVLLDCRVDKIVVDDGKVAGVKAARGDFRAPIVVSNANVSRRAV